MKRVFSILLIFLLFSLVSNVTFAQSGYVLPYPSSMPGGLSYKIHLIYEKVSKYWYFGDFGQFDYNLKLADKYLVEAKTLFEYKQYLLGYSALKKSDQYFMNVLPSLIKAEMNGKNIAQKRKIFSEASQKHVEVLRQMNVPGTFVWKPEKSISTDLNLNGAINESIHLRENNL